MVVCDIFTTFQTLTLFRAPTDHLTYFGVYNIKYIVVEITNNSNKITRSTAQRSFGIVFTDGSMAG